MPNPSAADFLASLTDPKMRNAAMAQIDRADAMPRTRTAPVKLNGPITLDLPYPPSVNAYWRSVVFGRAVRVLVSAAGLAYRKRLCAVVPQRQMAGRLSVTVDVYPPDRRRRDMDNVLKSLLDSLAHAGLYLDDSQIDSLTVERRDVEKPGRVVVTVTELKLTAASSTRNGNAILTPSTPNPLLS